MIPIRWRLFRESVESGILFLNQYGRETILWKSKKGNWLVTYKKGSSSTVYAEALTSTQAMSLLVKYDIETYEKIFGEIEEA